MGRYVLEKFRDGEWLLTNGLGGYALGFGNFTNRRKYNGLLVAAFENFRRVHILSGIEEKVEIGGAHFFLDSSHYVNCIYPNGYEHIVRAWLRPYPSVLYSSVPSDQNYLVFKEIFMMQRKNAIAVKYTNMGSETIFLILRPKFSMRDHHQLNTPGSINGVGFSLECNENSFHILRSDNNISAHGYFDHAEIIEDNVMYRDVFYPMEASRGYDASEDLTAPFRVQSTLMPGESNTFCVSAEKIESISKLFRETEDYYLSFPLPASHPRKCDPKNLVKDGFNDKEFPDFDDYIKILEMAADDFVAGDDIVAGYPWFTAWSRDTMISLSGLKYSRSPELAEKILLKYGESINRGLLPNTFGEGGGGLNYDGVDASLWYVVRCYEIAEKNVRLFNYCSKIIVNYIKNSNLPFYLDDDGLITIRDGFGAMTWMDAKVHGIPVTSRSGKPVEINALWYNALKCIQKMSGHHFTNKISSDGHSLSIGDLESLLNKVVESMNKFVVDGSLADRIENGLPVTEFRPNVVIALSLPFDPFGDDVMFNVWEKTCKKLLTPFGLRSLSPDHPAFKRKYIGNQKQRDLAYHQGTVWTQLLLPFVLLTKKIHGKSKHGDDFRRKIAQYVWQLRERISSGEASSVAEIWDGTDPSIPKGCPAQAWSVFALLEIEGVLRDLGL